MDLFNLLFTTKIPDTLRFRGFTLPHFILLLLMVLCVFLAARRIQARDQAGRQKMLLYFAWSLTCVYMLRFAVFFFLDIYVEEQMGLLDRLPFHLCALNAIVMPAAVTSKNKVLLNYIYAVAMPAAAAAMITPAMSYYGRYAYFSWQILSFFLDHGLMIAVSVLAVCSGLFRPDFRLIPKVAGLFLAYAALIYPVNKLLDQNYLFLNYPDSGTVMAFFAGYLGNPGYLAPMAMLTVVIIFLMYLPWIIADRKKASGEE